MSKIFYDHIILIDEIFAEIESLDLDEGEKLEMMQLVDELVHQRVLTHILDLLPKDHHEEFLDRFHYAPYDLVHFKYLNEKTDKDIYKELASLGILIKKDLRKDIKKHHRPKKKTSQK